MAEPLAKGFYSFVVHSPEEMGFPEYLLMLGEGVNTFNLTLEDPAEFSAVLLEHGVKIIEANRLDDLEPVTPDPMILQEAGLLFPLLGS